MNHVHEVVCTKALEDLPRKYGERTALLTSKRGRPSWSLASTNEASQMDLHTFFKHVKVRLTQLIESLWLCKCVEV